MHSLWNVCDPHGCTKISTAAGSLTKQLGHSCFPGIVLIFNRLFVSIYMYLKYWPKARVELIAKESPYSLNSLCSSSGVNKILILFNGGSRRVTCITGDLLKLLEIRNAIASST